MFKRKSVSGFEIADEQLQAAKEEHLRASGWDYTSSTPGFYWMWRRKIGDVDWFVDFDTAWRIQGIHEAETATGEDEPRD